MWRGVERAGGTVNQEDVVEGWLQGRNWGATELRIRCNLLTAKCFRPKY